MPDSRNAVVLGATEASWVNKLGPGLITGAADDDPSGIATYSQAGAQFGYNMLWTLVFTYPFMVAIQMISAKIGRVSGHGLATNIFRHYPSWLLYCLVGLLLVANTVNIAADVAAMGDALKLLIGGPAHWYALGFGLVSLVLQIFIPYIRYVHVLKWLTLALFAYVGIVFVVQIPWGVVLEKTFVPRLSWDAAFITTVVAVFGTTISPYLFFWQAEQEVEDQRERPGAHPLTHAPWEAKSEFTRIRIDTSLGMALSNVIAFFIVVTTAATLHAHGMTDIQTSGQAAEALRAVAGPFTFVIFAAGIIGTGLLTVPVLAGSAAYAVGELLSWRVGLARLPLRAKAFYGVIAAATLIGVALNFTHIDPVKALYWSAVLNGVVAVPVMMAMMHLSMRTGVMSSFTLPMALRVLGWLATATMAITVVAMAIAVFA